MNYQQQLFTVAFIFDHNFSHVLLVHKQKPDWQKGNVNGVGGKYETGETAFQCISRETKEETSLKIPESDWVYVGTIKQSAGEAGILTAQYSGAHDDAQKNDHEEIEWFPVDALPKNIMPNLAYFIPLCRQKLKEDGFKTFTIENNT